MQSIATTRGKKKLTILAALACVLELSLPADAKPCDDAVNAAKQLILIGKLQQAARVLSAGIEKDPKCSELFQLRGWCLFYLKKPYEAVKDIDKAMELDSTRYENWTTRAEILRHLAKYDESRKVLDKAIQISPARPEAYYLRGLACLLQGLQIRARKDFTSAIERGKSHRYLLYSYYWRGRTEEMQGDYRSAVADFDRSVNLDKMAREKPDKKDGFWLLTMDQQSTKGLGVLERGFCYGILGEHEKAIADLTIVLQSKPKETLLYEKRGHSYLCLGNYSEALKDFNRALLLGTESTEVYYQLGITHFCLKKFTNAASDMNAWLERTFWNDNTKTPLATVIGYVSMKRSQQDGAAKQLVDKFAEHQVEENGWTRSISALLAARITPQKLVSLTDKLPKKEKTRAQCYAALYFLSESKTQAAVPFLKWIKEQGDRKTDEYTISMCELGGILESHQGAIMSR